MSAVTTPTISPTISPTPSPTPSDAVTLASAQSAQFEVEIPKRWSTRLSNVYDALHSNVILGLYSDVSQVLTWNQPGRDYLSGSDSTFLLIEDRFRNMNIAGLYYFERKLEDAALLQQLKDYIAVLQEQIKNGQPSYRRMMSKLVFNRSSLLSRPYFEPCDDFKVENHMESLSLADYAAKLKMSLDTMEDSEVVLGLLCGELVGRDNEYEKMPAWKAYLIQDVMFEQEGKTVPTSVVLWVLSHAMADGEGTIRPLMSFLASLDPETGKPRTDGVTTDVQFDVTGRRGALGRVDGKGGKGGAGTSKANQVQGKPKPPSTTPVRSKNPYLHQFYALLLTLQFLVTGIAIFLINMLTLVFTNPGPRKSFHSSRGFSEKKQVGISKPLKLEDVKRVKNALGCTINDVILTITHHSVVKYARSRNTLNDNEFLYLIPTSLRSRSDISMSNQSSGWMLPLPTSTSISQNAAELPKLTSLLKIVRSKMTSHKMSVEPWVYQWVIRGMYKYPWLLSAPSVETKWGGWFWRTAGSKTLSAITNVPGPSVRLSLAGAPYVRYVPIIPLASHSGLGLAIASYADGISLGINMDLQENAKGEVFARGDARLMAREWEAAFEELLKFVKEKEKLDAMDGKKAD